ncbi:hypothetical protein B9Z52_08040 [Limnohabitans sp. Jir72]|nr:hypothetical protein B9Z52_08040 [Limnohabitans sp. Jir72]
MVQVVVSPQQVLFQPVDVAAFTLSVITVSSLTWPRACSEAVPSKTVLGECHAMGGLVPQYACQYDKVDFCSSTAVELKSKQFIGLQPVE